MSLAILDGRTVFLILITFSLVFWIWFGYANVGNVFVFIATIFALKFERNDPSQNEAKKFRNVILTILLIYVVLNATSFAFSMDEPYMDLGARGSDYFYGAVITATLGLGLRDERDILKILAILISVSGVYGLLELVAVPLDSSYRQGRFIGYESANANVMAMLLLMMFSLFLGYLFVVKCRLLGLVCGAGTIITGYLLFLTKTRFALLTMFFIAIPCTLFLNRKYGGIKKRVTAALLIIFFVAPLASYLWWHSAGRNDLDNAYRRMDSWVVSVEVAKAASWEKRLLGHGNFEGLYPNLFDHYGIDPKTHSRIAHTHNLYFQTFLETGISGLFALLSLWFLLFYFLIKVWLESDPNGINIAVPLLVAFVSIMTMGLMDYPLWDTYGSIAWFIMGLSFANIRVSLQSQEIKRRYICSDFVMSGPSTINR